MKKHTRMIVAIAALMITLFMMGMKTQEMRVKWLQSVVTEQWQQTGPSSWESVMPAVFGQRGDAQTVIGLREDGVVVWKLREGGKNYWSHKAEQKGTP